MTKNFLELFNTQYESNLKKMMSETYSDNAEKNYQKKYRILINMMESMQEEKSTFNISKKEIEGYINIFPRKSKKKALYAHLNRIY
jgi:hypothetical protein